MTTPSQPIPHRINVGMAPEVEVGVYADFVGVWHQPASFVLDFSVFTRPPTLGTDETGSQVVDLQARMAARIRIAPAQVFEIMKALESELSKWEIENGQRPPDPDQ